MATATAAANDIDAKFVDELTQCCGHWLRLHRIDGQPVDVERNTCIGNGRDRQRAMFRQEAYRFTHMLWACGAVQADNIDTALQQCSGLLTEDFDELLVRDIAEQGIVRRWEHSCGAD